MQSYWLSSRELRAIHSLIPEIVIQPYSWQECSDINVHHGLCITPIETIFGILHAQCLKSLPRVDSEFLQYAACAAHDYSVQKATHISHCPIIAIFSLH